MGSKIITLLPLLLILPMLSQRFVDADPILMDTAEPADSEEAEITSALQEIADELIRERANNDNDNYVSGMDKRGRLWGTRGSIGIVPFYKYRNAVNYGAQRHNHRLSSRYGWFRPRSGMGEYRPYIKRYPIPTYSDIEK